MLYSSGTDPIEKMERIIADFKAYGISNYAEYCLLAQMEQGFNTITGTNSTEAKRAAIHVFEGEIKKQLKNFERPWQEIAGLTIVGLISATAIFIGTTLISMAIGAMIGVSSGAFTGPGSALTAILGSIAGLFTGAIASATLATKLILGISVSVGLLGSAIGTSLIVGTTVFCTPSSRKLPNLSKCWQFIDTAQFYVNSLEKAPLLRRNQL